MDVYVGKPIYKIILLSAVVVYYLVFGGALKFFGINLMALQGVKPLSPSFADLRCIVAAHESVRAGYDPMINNPYDEWKRPLNYPYVWLSLEKFGFTQADVFCIGFIQAIIFYGCILMILVTVNTMANVSLWGLAILSPSVLLGIERGNNDLIVFIIISLCLLCLKSKNTFFNLLAFLGILGSAILKLFPIFAMLAVLRARKRYILILLFLFCSIFLAYLYFTWNDVLRISETTLRGDKFSYGNMVLFDAMQKRVVEKHFNFLSHPTIIHVLGYSFTAMALFFGTKIVLGKMDCSFISKGSHLDSFRIGAGIYVGTFMLGNNWDYRLIFLLFILPQLLEWKQQFSSNRLPKVILGLTFVSLWSGLLDKTLKLGGMIIGEASNWILFVCLVSLLFSEIIVILKSISHQNNNTPESCSP